MKKISIVSPTYNEVLNIEKLYDEIKKIINKNKNYLCEIIIIDNCSEDGTIDKLKRIAENDKTFKVILNTRNFGHIRSPYYGIISATGDAVVYMASDLQDPPELIEKFISEWEKGWKVVLGVKPKSYTNFIGHNFRTIYYILVQKISNLNIVTNATGFGLYDRQVINKIIEVDDRYPFFRGLLAELGYPTKLITFKQPKRQNGRSKNNIYTLYDTAILGIVSHSNIPLRLSSFIGYALALVSFSLALLYIVFKLLDWYTFPKGMAPLIVSIFILFSLMFMFMGIIGEYIAIIFINVKNRPIVVEDERINFESK
jgi:dolichol-phosphate mannosyltransferase